MEYWKSAPYLLATPNKERRVSLIHSGLCGAPASGFLNRVHKFDSCRGHFFLPRIGARRDAVFGAIYAALTGLSATSASTLTAYTFTA